MRDHIHGFEREMPEKRKNALYTKQCMPVILIYQMQLNLIPDLKTLPADGSVWIKLQNRLKEHVGLFTV